MLTSDGFPPLGAELLAGDYFVPAYPPFSYWTAEDVRAYQARLARPAEGGAPFGLYVHVPFCARRCDYCYYLSYAGKSPETIDGYLDALLGEAELYGRTPALAGRAADFVYFGGGTPSLLSLERIRRLIDGLKAAFPWHRAREVNFECAPQTVTGEKLRLLADAGVTRLSLGIQQLNDAVLLANGRMHLTADVERAYELVRAAGFPVVNVDLMVGLVAETDDTFFDSLQRIIGMDPDSVTIYQLEVRGNTPLFQSLKNGSRSDGLAPWTVKRARLARAFSRLREAGYTITSAYAAVKDPARHRFFYQEEQYHGADLIGLGVASFGYLDGTHYQNMASLGEYNAALAAGLLPLGRAYALSAEERMVREFVLQLKLGGCPTRYFQEKFGLNVLRRFAEPLAALAARGWLLLDAEHVRVTDEGLVRVDRLLDWFYLPRHRAASDCDW